MTVLSRRDQLLFGRLIRDTYALIVSPAVKQRLLQSKISWLFLLQHIKEGSGIMREITERQYETLQVIKNKLTKRGLLLHKEN